MNVVGFFIRIAVLCCFGLLSAVTSFAQIHRLPDGSSRPDPSTAQQEIDHSLPRLFSQVGRDFQQFPRKDNLLWLGIGAGLSGAAHPFDVDLTQSLHLSRRTENALDSGRIVGGPLVQFGGSFLTYAVGRLSNKPKITHTGSDLIRAQILASGVTQAMKFATRRTRPDGTSFAFPSGHTAAAFASGAVLKNHYGWKAGVPAYAVASFVAASRLSENRHYASDVIFGATIGFLAARTVNIGRGSLRFTVTPIVTPQGAGIALVKVSR